MFIFLLVLMTLIGAILCFSGYRFLRLSMGISGFLLGIFLGHSICVLNNSFWSTIPAYWTYIFIIILAAIMALTSFKLYKAALFYTSSLFSAILFLRLYLSVSGNANLVTTFLVSLFDKTALGGAVSTVTDASISGNERVGDILSDSMSKVWAGNNNAWFIVGICIAAGVLVGFLVVFFQKPAIIVLTSVFGAHVIMQAFFSFTQRSSMQERDIFSLVEATVSENGIGLDLVILLFLASVGIVVQIKKSSVKCE